MKLFSMVLIPPPSHSLLKIFAGLRVAVVVQPSLVITEPKFASRTECSLLCMQCIPC